MFAIAAVALAIGALTLGALTSPAPEATLETSTTTTTTIEVLEQPIDYDHFTVEQIATGEQLNWRQVAIGQGGGGTGLISQLGVLYMFTPSQVTVVGEPSGLRAYRSFDGSSWEDLGEVIATDGFVAAVGATPFGLMAIESNSSDGPVVAWRSTDAIDWEPTVIEQSDSSVAFHSDAIGANSGLVVVAGSVHDDGTPILQRRLADYGLDIDLRSVGWSIDSYGEDATVVLYGPLGITAMSIPVSEIGLTEEERILLQRGTIGEGEAAVWSTSDGVTWIPSTIERVNWVSSITPSPDGSLLVFGFDSAGHGLWRTFDGVTWEKLPFGLRAERAAQWRGQLAGLSGQGPPEVLVSSDGETWSELGLADYFPTRIGWSPTAIATSDAAIAVTVQGFHQDASSGRVEQAEPLVLERNGTKLTLDLEQGLIGMDDGETIRSWYVYGNATNPEDLVVDLIGRTVTFLDSTGQQLVTFGFDELEQAEQEYFVSTYPPNVTFDALAYTQDGNSWAIQDLDEAFGPGTRVLGLAATPFALVAVVQPSEVYFTSGEGEIQIWYAHLP